LCVLAQRRLQRRLHGLSVIEARICVVRLLQGHASIVRVDGQALLELGRQQAHQANELGVGQRMNALVVTACRCVGLCERFCFAQYWRWMSDGWLGQRGRLAR
jgi:hypothetical protein